MARWRLGVVWVLILLAMYGLAEALVSFFDLSRQHHWRLQLTCVVAGVSANVLRAILERFLARRTADPRG